MCDTVQDAASDQKNALGRLISTHDARYIAPFEEGRERLDGSPEATRHLRGGRPALPAPRRARRSTAAKQWTASFAQPRIDAVRFARNHGRRERRRQQRDGRGPRGGRDIHAGRSRLLHAQDQAQAGAYRTSRIALLLGSAAALAFVILILGRSARQLITERRLAEETAARLAQALDRAQAGERTRADSGEHEPRDAGRRSTVSPAWPKRPGPRPSMRRQREMVDTIGRSPPLSFEPHHRQPAGRLAREEGMTHDATAASPALQTPPPRCVRGPPPPFAAEAAAKGPR